MLLLENIQILGINYILIYSYNDYDNAKSLLGNSEEIFHLEDSKIDKNRPSKVLNNEVLKRKEEFLAYNITLEKDNNEKLIVKEISNAEVDVTINKENNAQSNSNIIQKAEIHTRGLFEMPGTHISSYETDLMANDMTYNSDVNLYHKVITVQDDYNKYDERIDLPEVDLNENFIVVIANENFRSEDETDLTIEKIVSDENTTQIVMKQKENPTFYATDVNRATGNNYYNDNNVFWAVVNLSELRDNIVVRIEK